MTSKRSAWIDSLILICFAFLLVKSLFRLNYLDQWGSIESTFISDSRMIGEHLPHTGWQPMWYCGTRSDYVYPPALRYGTALISRFGHVIPARAYHLYIGIFYIFGIAAVYWLLRTGSGSRAGAWLASVATALLSPSFLFLAKNRMDSAFLVPQRLHVLMAYGEGPHISALSILPAALAACFVALRGRSSRVLALAGTLCALVVANNFYGATALAIFYPILVWSVWLSERSREVVLRACAIPALAYGLSAFWLTPSYVGITLTDLKWVSEPGTLSARLVLLAVAALFGYISFRAGRGRGARQWPIFVCGSAAILSVYVLGYFYFGLNISGDAERLIPELDLALILGAAELFRVLWARPRFRVATATVILAAFAGSIPYLTHLRAPFPKAGPLDGVYEYGMAKWVSEHLPGSRVYATGSVRYWLDAWTDNPQLDGGSKQGMLNQIVPVAGYQILTGREPDLSTLWLQALGTDAIVVVGKSSPEHYHDYLHPEKFRGALTSIYDDGKDTIIYAIPRVHPGIARVVSGAAMGAVGRLEGGADRNTLRRYVAAVEDPSRSAATLSWQGFDEATVEATTAAGDSILVQETWDPAWHAREGDRELIVRPDRAMGFMLIDVPEGSHTVRMRFETPAENRIGQVLFGIAAIAVLGLAIRR